MTERFQPKFGVLGLSKHKMPTNKPVQLVYRQLGMRVEQLRTLLGWSQEDLAKKVHLTRGSVANIETGRQRILLHDIERFAEAFNTSPKNLLRGIWT